MKPSKMTFLLEKRKGQGNHPGQAYKSNKMLEVSKAVAHLQMALNFIIRQPINLHQLSDLLWSGRCKCFEISTLSDDA